MTAFNLQTSKFEVITAHSRARYLLEPHISKFAGFASARGARVLEIGVGMGADYLEWLKAGAFVTGVDLSASSIAQARRRCEYAGYISDLEVADAENLPFADNTFDVVYSYGVMHHSADTQQCLDEAWRVLKPDRQARIMLYEMTDQTLSHRRRPDRQTKYVNCQANRQNEES